jgi:hypothetical protein
MSYNMMLGYDLDKGYDIYDCFIQRSIFDCVKK